MVTVHIRVIRNDVIQNLQDLLDKLQNLTPFMTDVADIVQNQLAANFAAQDWPPLKAQTLYLKVVKGYPADSLVRLGELKRAATADWDVQGNIATLSIPGYAAFHVGGTRFMPARDFTMMPDSVAERVGLALINFIYDRPWGYA